MRCISECTKSNDVHLSNNPQLLSSSLFHIRLAFIAPVSLVPYSTSEYVMSSGASFGYVLVNSENVLRVHWVLIEPCMHGGGGWVRDVPHSVIEDVSIGYIHYAWGGVWISAWLVLPG